MTGDEYVLSVLKKYEVPRGPQSVTERSANQIAPTLRKWAGTWLNDLFYSGSYAKQTGVHGVADIDIFISLRSDTPGTLKDNFEQLYSLSSSNSWSPRRQNVSIGISINGVNIDLVPGRVQSGYQNYHSLYWRKADSWRQTNIKLHVDTVTNSNRAREIRAVKIWRYLHEIDWPSLYLELFVIDALKGRSTGNLAENILFSLRAIRDSLETKRIIDPANTNNILSNDLTAQEKRSIATLAKQSAAEQYWKNIIW